MADHMKQTGHATKKLRVTVVQPQERRVPQNVHDGFKPWNHRLWKTSGPQKQNIFEAEGCAEKVVYPESHSSTHTLSETTDYTHLNACKI